MDRKSNFGYLFAHFFYVRKKRLLESSILLWGLLCITACAVISDRSPGLSYPPEILVQLDAVAYKAPS